MYVRPAKRNEEPNVTFETVVHVRVCAMYMYVKLKYTSKVLLSWKLGLLKNYLNEKKIKRKDHFVAVSCPIGMEYNTCGSACARTCKNMVYDCDDSRCIDGCHCPADKVLHNGRCITRNTCPCTAHGRSYLPGKTTKRDCNKWYANWNKASLFCCSVDFQITFYFLSELDKYLNRQSAK